LADSTSGNKGALALLFSVLVALVLADWFFGSFTRDLLRGNGVLSVKSEPAGARVLVDTLELGVTPLSNVDVPVGDYVLRVEHPYSKAHREPIVVARGEQLERTFTLVPDVGRLELVSNPRGATIAIDGQVHGEVTPVKIKMLNAGLHEVRLSLPGRRVVKEQVEVLPGQATKLVVDIERLPLGELVLSITPRDAQVELFAVVDGEVEANALDYSPGASLPAQDYLVRVSRNGYETKEQRFLIRRGKNSYAIDLQQRMGTLKVNVQPQGAQVRVSAAGQNFTYKEPVELPVGRVTLRTTKKGFRSATKNLTLDSAGATVAVALKKYNVSVGRVFRDPLKSGGEGPQMVVLGAGSYRMGDVSGAGAAHARPAHNVQLEAPFAMGVYEISNAQWSRRSGESGDKQPVVNVTRDQVVEYLQWLSRETGSQYRLPSEAEWEYAARAGSTKLFGVTDSPQDVCRTANVADQSLTRRFPKWQVMPCNDGAERLSPIGNYAPNSFGLYDMTGNASEMLADCWHDTYKGAPTNGSAWGRSCSVWVARGGAWDHSGDALHISHRERVQNKGGELGFRVVREL